MGRMQYHNEPLLAWPRSKARTQASPHQVKAPYATDYDKGDPLPLRRPPSSSKYTSRRVSKAQCLPDKPTESVPAMQNEVRYPRGSSWNLINKLDQNNEYVAPTSHARGTIQTLEHTLNTGQSPPREGRRNSYPTKITETDPALNRLGKKSKLLEDEVYKQYVQKGEVTERLTTEAREMQRQVKSELFFDPKDSRGPRSQAQRDARLERYSPSKVDRRDVDTKKWFAAHRKRQQADDSTVWSGAAGLPAFPRQPRTTPDVRQERRIRGETPFGENSRMSLHSRYEDEMGSMHSTDGYRLRNRPVHRLRGEGYCRPVYSICFRSFLCMDYYVFVLRDLRRVKPTQEITWVMLPVRYHVESVFQKSIPDQGILAR